jgi:hypothetical protein
MERLVQHPIALTIERKQGEVDIQAGEHAGIGEALVQ